ncbi:hypothetical protein C8R44DRAFT_297158 [Mycena epipterygia]|nr:hypothetical protein C8R44DRAFT_297158 [Mycena epipterygia]
MTSTNSLRDRLLQLSAEICLLPHTEAATIIRLQDEQQSIQNTLHLIVYPILTIPPELTIEIFLHCLPDVPWEPNASVAPMLLGAVCRQWREIAWNTPALWNSLTIEWRWEEKRDLKSLMEWWLSRGANTLRISSERSVDEFETMILGTIQRWSNLQFRMYPGSAEACLKTAQPLPLLRTLDLRLLSYYVGPDPLSIFSDTPALRTVHLHYITPSICILPWHQLTDFLGEFYTVDECLEVLRQCPCLIKCSFTKTSLRRAGDPDRVTTLLHPLLQSLTILNGLDDSDSYYDAGRGEASQRVQVFDFLTAPALQELALHHVSLFPPFIRFLSRCCPPLHKLQLSLDDLESDIFSLLPGLVILDLDFCRWDRDVFSQFCTILHTSASFLPNLADCSISISGPTPGRLPRADYTLLINALASRLESRPGVAKLQRFIFTQYTGSLPDALVLDRIRSELIQQGMSIRLETTKGSWP